MMVFPIGKTYSAYNPFVKFLAFWMAIGAVLRIVLLSNGQTVADFGIGGYASIFCVGFLNDACVGVAALFLVWLNIILMSESKYCRPFGYIIFGLFLSAFIYVTFFHTIFDEYGSVAPAVAQCLFAYKAASFGIRLFAPAVRQRWRSISLFVLFFTMVLLSLFNTVSEYLFWDEFGVRYNFIAVDYLVYTNEVIGNIIESYPVVPIAFALVAASAAITFFFIKPSQSFGIYALNLRQRLRASLGYAVLLCLSFLLLTQTGAFQNSSNAFVRELSSSGLYKFYLAYRSSRIDYDQFYATIDKKVAVSLLNKEYGSNDPRNTRYIIDRHPEVRKNIVLITVESLSASFLSHFGNTEGLTPNVDSLMEKSLYFSNLFANGNRSVRGLEAVTLCIPPSPGESIIKRKNNSNLFSTGKLLRSKGYAVQFLYGGDSYFDNMKSFFEGNGYEIIDKNSIAPNHITFSNIWGVCDEDLFAQAIRTFNGNAKSNKPFFAHIMTVSNHRPFTYPDGRIDIPASDQSRRGGVKYTDYALGRFFAEAARQPWFANTVFVVTADHCASSAGKVDIPVEKYHIPAFVYAPGFVKPSKVDVLASQIDIMPTVFGLLHFSYKSRFYGSNVLDSTYAPRAFLATYQNLGYWNDSVMTVLSPVRRVEQFKVKSSNTSFEQKLLPTVIKHYERKAIANYQSLDYWL